MDKEYLEMLASKLMFTMDDCEYETLLQEFEVMLEQMDLICQIPDIEKVEPMTFPFELENVCLREDEVVDELQVSDILLNSDSNLYNQVKLPKVVE